MRSMSSTRSSPPDPQRPADAGNLDGGGGSADPAGDCSMQLLGMDAAAAAGGTDIHTSSSNVNTSSSNSNDNNNNPSSSSVGGAGGGAGAGSDMSSSSNSGGTTIASGGATSYGSPPAPGCGQGAGSGSGGPAYTNAGAGAGSVDSGGSMIRTDSHHSLLAMGFPSVSGSTPGPGPQQQQQQELSDSSPGTSSRGSESACVPSHHHGQHHCGCDACGCDDPDSLLLAMDVASCSAGVPESTAPGGCGNHGGPSDWNGFWMPSVVGGEPCHLDVEPAPQDDDDEEQRVMHHLMSAPASTGFLHNMDHHHDHHMQHGHGHHHGHHQSSMALGGMFGNGGGGRRGLSDDIDMVHMAHIPEVDHFCESLLNVEDHHQQQQQPHNVMGVRGSMGMVSNLDTTSCYNMGNHGSGSAMWSPMQQQHMEAPAPAPSWMDAPLQSAHSRHSTTQLSSSLVHHRDSPSVVVTSSSCSAGHLGHGSWTYSPGPPPPTSSYTMDALSMPFHHHHGHHHSPAPAPQRGPVVTADMSSSPPAGLHAHHLHHHQQQQHMLTRRHSSSWTPSGSDFTFFNTTTGTPSSSPPTMPLSSSPSPQHLVRSLSTSALGSEHHLYLDTSCSTGGTASGVSLVGPPGRRHSPGIKRSLSFMHSTMSPPSSCDDDGALALDPVAGSPRRGSPSKAYRGDTGNGPATSSVAMAMAGVSSPPDTSAAAAAAAGGSSQLALQGLKLAMGLGTGATNSSTTSNTTSNNNNNNNATMASPAAGATTTSSATTTTSSTTTSSSGGPGAPPFRPGIDDAAAQLSALLYTKSRTDIGNNAISQYHKLAFQNSFYSAANAAAQAAAGAGTKADGSGLTSGVLGGGTSSGTSTTKTAARRRHGTATDPQSIAARTRRERFSDRIRILQSLVPNGERLDTVSMLGQTLEYVRFLQQQVWQLYNGAPGPLSAAGGMHGGMHAGMHGAAAAAAATNLNLAAQVASAESLAASFLSSMAQRQAAAAAAAAASSGGGPGEVQQMMSGGAGGPMPTKAGHGGGGPPGPLDKWKMAGNGGSPQCTPVA